MVASFQQNMIVNDVKSTLRSALKRYSNTCVIPIMDVRIKVFNNPRKGMMELVLLNKTAINKQVLLREVLGIGLIDPFGKEGKVQNFLTAAIEKAVELTGTTEVDFRFYAKDVSGDPGICLFVKNNPHKDLTLEEILNFC